MQVVTRRDKKRVSKHIESAVKEYLGALYVGVSTTPIGVSYPSWGFTLSFWINLDWPEGYDATYPIAGQVHNEGYPGITVWPAPNILDSDVYERVAPYMGSIDEKLCAFLLSIGCSDYNIGHWSTDEKPFTLSITYPPLGADDEHDERALQYYRAMTEEELCVFRLQEGRDPFSDEYWICTKYAGINFGRICTISADAVRGMTGVKQDAV